jgi:hypothetical protein
MQLHLQKQRRKRTHTGGAGIGVRLKRREFISDRFITRREKFLLGFLEYWDCEMFFEGLRDLGLIGGKQYWWDCELFQAGLKELGLI